MSGTETGGNSADDIKGDAIADLTSDYFEPHIGSIFSFRGTPYAFPLHKVVADDRQPPEWIKRRAFTLIFRGPKGTGVLPEGLYVCDIGSGPSVSIYVTPIHTPEPHSQDYQAVFN